MQELNMEELKAKAGGGGHCGRDKNGGGSNHNPKKSHCGKKS